MFVCERCHDIDLVATQCNYTYKVHLTLIDKTATEVACEMCGKISKCIFCDDYRSEIITRSHIKRYAEIKKREKHAHM